MILIIFWRYFSREYHNLILFDDARAWFFYSIQIGWPTQLRIALVRTAFSTSDKKSPNIIRNTNPRIPPARINFELFSYTKNRKLYVIYFSTSILESTGKLSLFSQYLS